MKLWLIVGLLVFLAACTSGDGSLPSTAHAYSGNDGVTIEFLDKLFPDTYVNPINQPRPMKIGVEVINEGAVEAKDVFLTLTTVKEVIEPNDPRGTERVFTLFGRERIPNAKVGGRELLDFDALMHRVELPPSNRWNTIVEVSACYQYETRAGTPICVNTNEFAITDIESTCETKDIRLKSQGAPVAVTKVSPLLEAEGSTGITHVRPTFRIFLKNVGDGDILDENHYRTGCNDISIEPEYLNKVRVSAMFGNDVLDCDETLSFSRTDKENFVTCRSGQRFSVNDPEFTRNLRVILNYGYRVTESKIVTIE